MDSIDDRLSPEEEAFLDQVDGQSGAPGEVEQHNLAEQEEFDWGQFDDFDLNHAAELEEERDRYRQGMKDYMEEKEDEDEEGDQLEDAFHELQRSTTSWAPCATVNGSTSSIYQRNFATRRRSRPHILRSAPPFWTPPTQQRPEDFLPPHIARMMHHQ